MEKKFIFHLDSLFLYSYILHRSNTLEFNLIDKIKQNNSKLKSLGITLIFLKILLFKIFGVEFISFILFKNKKDTIADINKVKAVSIMFLFSNLLHILIHLLLNFQQKFYNLLKYV